MAIMNYKRLTMLGALLAMLCAPAHAFTNRWKFRFGGSRTPTCGGLNESCCPPEEMEEVPTSGGPEFLCNDPSLFCRSTQIGQSRSIPPSTLWERVCLECGKEGNACCPTGTPCEVEGNVCAIFNDEGPSECTTCDLAQFALNYAEGSPLREACEGDTEEEEGCGKQGTPCCTEGPQCLVEGNVCAIFNDEGPSECTTCEIARTALNYAEGSPLREACEDDTLECETEADCEDSPILQDSLCGASCHDGQCAFFCA